MAFLKGPEVPPLPTKDILSWIFDEPTYDVNKPVFIDATNIKRSLSLSQAQHVVRQLIAGFRAQGIKPGDCVLIHAFNDVYYMMLALAIIGTGAVFAGSNPGYTPFELSHHIKATSASWLILEAETLPTVLSVTKTISIPSSHLIIFHPLDTQSCPSGYTSWLTLLQHGTADWVRFDDYNTCKTTTAARFTSSGTSGLPKATINTHLNMIAQHEFNYSPLFYKRPWETVNLWSLPMFHAAVAPRALTSIWKLGEKAYIMRRFEVDAFVRNIERFGVTDLFGVPPMLVAIIMHMPVQKGEVSLRSIRSGAVGAAPLTKETQARITSYLAPGATFTQVWGMTESNCIASRFPWGEADETGSVGYLSPGMEGKIVDVETGEEIREYGRRGEACVRGESVIPGYFNNAEATRKSWDPDGFYHSGDVIYVDEKTKKLYIVDRVKELIKVRAFQVAPPEVEGVLLEMEGIVDAAVIGVKDDKDGEGEACRAYVVTRPGWEGKLTERDVYDWVKERLVKYKHLDGGVKFVPQIPKTPSGKILKRLLRDEFEKEQRLEKGRAKL
ncbi:uncharacterized protein HMPREF1541_02267 [Cyphellophora europaea CBS 101466]|uniref:AMP-dependent synthetase/ligase domain-containing protein n=1 Tax=Cyphellophora europaea (strain CBS 101466) TaxID=1220924 RepID=W2S581_CYPE1|nr:uncharacterized protein HMPREF1541_02267 [Cyphellophora europaea CBS 101466]ETN43109.1 hypothetical protein HMPREF1541_02267 [Cyphellophora europaea CBS 101466]